MDALARKILALPPESRALTVDCHHDVCRVDFDRQAFPGPNDWKKLATPEWWGGRPLVNGRLALPLRHPAETGYALSPGTPVP